MLPVFSEKGLIYMLLGVVVLFMKSPMTIYYGITISLCLQIFQGTVLVSAGGLL
jgi:hypothetical protein